MSINSVWTNNVAAFSCVAVSGSVHEAAWTFDPLQLNTLNNLTMQAVHTSALYMGAPEAGVKSSGIWDTVVAPGLLDCWSWPVSGQPVRTQWVA